MKSLNQLLLDFDYEQKFKDDDFYVAKSNFYAFEMINKCLEKDIPFDVEFRLKTKRIPLTPSCPPTHSL